MDTIVARSDTNHITISVCSRTASTAHSLTLRRETNANWPDGANVKGGAALHCAGGWRQGGAAGPAGAGAWGQLGPPTGPWRNGLF